MYYHRTAVGTFLIVERAGRWHILFKDESLGSYATPRQAADDLAGGHTFSPGKSIDTSKLGVPDDIGEWQTGKP
jgi:hypothetical protein